MSIEVTEVASADGDAKALASRKKLSTARVVNVIAGSYRNVLENPILIGRFTILGGDTFEFTSDILFDEMVKARLTHAVELEILVKA